MQLPTTLLLEVVLPVSLGVFALHQVYKDCKDHHVPKFALASVLLLLYFVGWRPIRDGHCPTGRITRYHSETSGLLEPSLLSWDCSGDFLVLLLQVFISVDTAEEVYRKWGQSTEEHENEIPPEKQA